jgi:hypothetical protein
MSIRPPLSLRPILHRARGTQDPAADSTDEGEPIGVLVNEPGRDAETPRGFLDGNVLVRLLAASVRRR